MSTPTRDLIIYGAGGMGQEVVSMCESGCHAGRDTPLWRVIGFADDTPGLEGQTIHGITCLGSLAVTAALREGQETWCHIAIGHNEHRMEASKRIAAFGWKPAIVVHHSAYLSWEVEVGEGSFIGPHTTISPNVTIGRYVLINTRASIGHHVHLGAFSQVSLAASLLGRSTIESGAIIGAHGVVMSNVTVGAWATVGIGTPILTNVKAGHTVSMPLAKTFFKRQTFPDSDASA